MNGVILLGSGHTVWVDEADMPLLSKLGWHVNNCRGKSYAQARYICSNCECKRAHHGEAQDV